MKDLLSRIGQWTEKMWRSIPIHLRDAIFTALLLGIAAAICFVLRSIDENGSFTLLIFVLAVVIISRFTEGYFWGVFSSLFGVICVNFVFTYPFWAFNFRLTGYPLTFLTMLAVSLIISAMNTKIKKQERLRTEAERETMRANLLRAMSHDIRTPLTSIVGNTSAILENGDTLSIEQQRELLRDVNEDAQWLIRMVENLLSITRISGEQTAISKEYEAAEEILAASVHKFEKRFKSNIRIAVEVPREVVLVPMDATLIQQVLLNLMENAVRAVRDSLVAEHAARANYANGRFLVLHRADLNRTGVRAQQDIGVLFDEEGILHVAGRMFGWKVQRRENMPVVLDFRAFGHRVTQARKNADDLVFDQ